MITILRLRGFDALKEAASNCPNCILAALRQSGLGIGRLEEDEDGKKYIEPQIQWDYKEASAAFWANVNEAACEAESYYD
jgi:hypothetical protein